MMKAIKKVSLANDEDMSIGEAVVLIPECGIQTFDVVAYHDNGDIDVFTRDEGIGILTIGSGYWIDTRSASNFVDKIKDIFAKKGIKVVKSGNL